MVFKKTPETFRMLLLQLIQFSDVFPYEFLVPFRIVFLETLGTLFNLRPAPFHQFSKRLRILLTKRFEPSAKLAPMLLGNLAKFFRILFSKPFEPFFDLTFVLLNRVPKGLRILFAQRS